MTKNNVINRNEMYNDKFITVSEASKMIAVSKQTIYRLIKNGDLTIFRPSKRIIRIYRFSIDALVKDKTYNDIQ